MLTNIVTDGDKVELQTMDKVQNGDKKPRTYLSKVYTVVSDDRVEIMMPMEKTKLILLPIDGEYNVCFYTSNGLYQCYARIYDRYKSNNVYVLALELTSNLRKHQRREYYRFSCVIDMKMRELKKDEVDAIENGHPMIVPGLPLSRALICDISGGGIRLITNSVFDEGTYVYCDFNLDNNGHQKEYEILGLVLKNKELVNRPGEYEHRIQYVELDTDMREEIIKYIFEEERKLRRKVKK